MSSQKKVLGTIFTKATKETMLPKEQLEKLVDEPDSGIYKVRQVVHVALHPMYINNFGLGLINYFNKQINQWHPQLDGILAGYGKLQLRRPTGVIMNEEVHIHVDVQSDFWVFRPIVGCQLKGIVAKKSPTHVSCLVHGVFNVPCHRPHDIKGTQAWWGLRVKLKQTARLTVLKTDMSQRVPLIMGDLQNIGLDGNDVQEVFTMDTTGTISPTVEELSESEWNITTNSTKFTDESDSGIDSVEKKQQELLSSAAAMILSPQSSKKQKKSKKGKKDRELLVEESSIIINEPPKSIEVENQQEMLISNLLNIENLHHKKDKKKKKKRDKKDLEEADPPETPEPPKSPSKKGPKSPTKAVTTTTSPSKAAPKSPIKATTSPSKAAPKSPIKATASPTKSPKKSPTKRKNEDATPARAPPKKRSKKDLSFETSTPVIANAVAEMNQSSGSPMLDESSTKKSKKEKKSKDKDISANPEPEVAEMNQSIGSAMLDESSTKKSKKEKKSKDKDISANPEPEVAEMNQSIGSPMLDESSTKKSKKKKSKDKDISANPEPEFMQNNQNLLIQSIMAKMITKKSKK